MRTPYNPRRKQFIRKKFLHRRHHFGLLNLLDFGFILPMHRRVFARDELAGHMILQSIILLQALIIQANRLLFGRFKILF